MKKWQIVLLTICFLLVSWSIRAQGGSWWKAGLIILLFMPFGNILIKKVKNWIDKKINQKIL
jgi:hypothetical protein